MNLELYLLIKLNISGISTFSGDVYANQRISIGGENPAHFYSGADNLVVADFSADAGISIFGGTSNKSTLQWVLQHLELVL